jgi:hypothetical protein
MPDRKKTSAKVLREDICPLVKGLRGRIPEHPGA